MSDSCDGGDTYMGDTNIYGRHTPIWETHTF